MNCLQCKKPVKWYHRKVKGPPYQGKPFYVFHQHCAGEWRATVDIKALGGTDWKAEGSPEVALGRTLLEEAVRRQGIQARCQGSLCLSAYEHVEGCPVYDEMSPPHQQPSELEPALTKAANVASMVDALSAAACDDHRTVNCPDCLASVE